MTNPANPRRRPSVHITLPCAARLHRLVRFLAEKPASPQRDLVGFENWPADVLSRARPAQPVWREGSPQGQALSPVPTAAEAEGRLPFPDPQLSFAEMAELSQCPCPAGARLAELLAAVINPPEPLKKKRTGKSSTGKKPKV